MSTASTIEQEMLALINQERTSRGLDPLKLETRLNASAEDHSEWMLDSDRFSHTGSGGSSATERMRDAGFDFSGSWRSGENIAWQSERGAPGISDDVEQLHQSLMNSPGHRANILNPDFEYIGIGIEEGDYDGWDAVMVTQNFATTDGQVVLDSGMVSAPPVEDVSAPQDVVPEEPEVDVTEAEEPDTSSPEVEEPSPAQPQTAPSAPIDEAVAEPEEPADAIPDTDVTATQEPADATPETDVTTTQKPTAETPQNTPFDVDGFLAAILGFLNGPTMETDDFELTEAEPVEADMAEDDFMLTWDICDDTAAETAPESPAFDIPQNDFWAQMWFNDDNVMSLF